MCMPHAQNSLAGTARRVRALGNALLFPAQDRERTLTTGIREALLNGSLCAAACATDPLEGERQSRAPGAARLCCSYIADLKAVLNAFCCAPQHAQQIPGRESAAEEGEGHCDSVLALACHPRLAMFATGALQKDRTIKLWVDRNDPSIQAGLPQ